MATQQYDATDANGQTVQLTNSDDPAEGGGATLQDIVSALQSAQDVSGATVTVTDDGAFNITLDAQNAGLAQDSTIADQTSYSDVTVDASGGLSPTDAFDAIMPGTVDGSLQVTDGTGTDVTIPQAALQSGVPLPITVEAVKTGGTASTTMLSELILLRE
jgi:citrate lyase gamma subunit